MIDLVVIGGGASGMVASIVAARTGLKVVLIEKMEKLGRKLRITGKGRCNITNTKEWSQFSQHIYPNTNFLRSAFYSFSNNHVIEFFNEIGLETVIERGDRVFPKSGLAKDVVDALERELRRLGVEILLNSQVTNIFDQNSIISSVELNNNQIIKCKSVILCTGGLSYPLTGSTGDGYIMASKLGHKIERCFPSLTALMPSAYDRSLEGLTLKNVSISLIIDKDIVQTEFGDIDFTNNGIEGPIGFKISRKAVKAMINGGKVSLILDLKPSLSNDQLINRFERDLEKMGSVNTIDYLKKVLPSQFIASFVKVSSLPDKISNRGNMERLAQALKNVKFDVVSYTSYQRAVVTAGGISLSEIVPKTMQSKLINNLFFAGEVIDLDGDTGGYNLQIAFSTAALAAKSASYFISKQNNG